MKRWRLTQCVVVSRQLETLQLYAFDEAGELLAFFPIVPGALLPEGTRRLDVRDGQGRSIEAAIAFEPVELPELAPEKGNDDGS